MNHRTLHPFLWLALAYTMADPRQVAAGDDKPVAGTQQAQTFEKEVLVNASRISFQSQRMSSQLRHQHRSNPGVIINHLPLGEAGRWIKHFIEIRKREVFTLDFDGGCSTHCVLPGTPLTSDNFIRLSCNGILNGFL